MKTAGKIAWKIFTTSGDIFFAIPIQVRVVVFILLLLLTFAATTAIGMTGFVLPTETAVQTYDELPLSEVGLGPYVVNLGLWTPVYWDSDSHSVIFTSYGVRVEKYLRQFEIKHKSMFDDQNRIIVENGDYLIPIEEGGLAYADYSVIVNVKDPIEAFKTHQDFKSLFDEIKFKIDRDLQTKTLSIKDVTGKRVENRESELKNSINSTLKGVEIDTFILYFSKVH